MLNNLATDQKDLFYQEHGDFVVTPEGPILFQDGAMDENSMSGMGRLIPPPADAYELATLQLRDAQIVAEQSEEQFLAFKQYLGGTGRREAAWAALHLESQQIDHLKYLRSQAMRARAKLSKAKKRGKDERPCWMQSCLQNTTGYLINDEGYILEEDVPAFQSRMNSMSSGYRLEVWKVAKYEDYDG